MGTKKTNLEREDSYKYMNYKILKEYHCEKINIQMRDKFEIPMVIKYDKRYYSE